MPVCPNCGSQRPDGAAFCDNCGAKLEEAAHVVAAPAAAPAQPSPTAVTTACPDCGTPVTPGEAFCGNCGAPLGPAAPASPPLAATPAPAASAWVCPHCGAELEPGSNFCDMCGARVSETAPPAPSPAPAPAPPHISAPVPSPAPAPPPPAQPAPAHPPQAVAWGHLVVQSTNAALPLPPDKTEVIIGREDPVSGIFPDIDLTDHGGDEGGVSRQHARIFVQGNQVFIEDLNSTNYTHVNQRRLTPGQPHPLNSGDEIWLGRLKFHFYST
jgi:hypothetical protein